jgi:integrase
MLTQRKIERAKPGRYHDGHGLYLVVHNKNNKSFAFRWERDGRERWMGLGPIHTIDLKQARAKAREARLLLLEGIDPLDQRKLERAKLAAAKAKLFLFREAAQQYFDQHESKWRNAKHRWQWLTTVRMFAFPVIGDMPLGEIDTAAVLRVIEPHWRTKTETMSRLRGRIEAVLDWGTVRGYRSGDNPARWKGHLSEVLPRPSQLAKVEHYPALPYRDIPAFMAELRKRDGVGARALEFLILTCARTNEVLGAKWEPEIDLTSKMWTVPAGRMKAGQEHRVALSAAAVQLLKRLPTEDGNDFVFIGPRPASGLSSAILMQTLRRMGHDDVSVHGMRSVFREWAAEQTNFPREVCELALAHKVGDKVERAYQRGDLLKKRFLLAEAWSKYCSSPPQKADEKTVVPIHTRGAAR